MEENTLSRDSRKERLNLDDRRVKKTKRLLKESLFKLLEQKSVNRITVSELTRLADVNRSTFYFYYKDVYDMFEQIQDEVYEVFAEEVISTDSVFASVDEYIEYIRKFLIFCKENAIVCKFVMSNDTNNQLGAKIKSELERNIPDSTIVFKKDDPRYYLTNFAISAMLWTIIKWMNDDMEVDPKDMAVFLSYTYLNGARSIKEFQFGK